MPSKCRLIYLTGPCDHVDIPCEEGRFYPDKGFCERYYNCTNGQLEGMQCSLYHDAIYNRTLYRLFNESQQSCVPWKPGGCNVVCPTLPPTTQITTTKGSSLTGATWEMTSSDSVPGSTTTKGAVKRRPPGSKPNNTGMVAGIIVGALIGVGLIAVIVVLVMKHYELICFNRSVGPWFKGRATGTVPEPNYPTSNMTNMPQIITSHN